MWAVARAVSGCLIERGRREYGKVGAGVKGMLRRSKAGTVESRNAGSGGERETWPRLLKGCVGSVQVWVG